MQLETLINAESALIKLGKQDLPITISFKLSELVCKLEPYINNFNQQKDKLLIKYGVTKGDGQYCITGENVKPFQKEISELLQIEIQEKFEKVCIPLNDKILLSVIDIHTLKGLIEFKENNIERVM